MKEEKTNKQTNKHKMGEEMKNSSLPFKSECCLQACSAVDVALQLQPLVYFFLLLPLPMLGRFLSSLTYFMCRKGCPALCLVIEAVPLVCHTISGSQGCLAWEKLHGNGPKSALHALLFLLSLIRVHTMKTTATASFSSSPPNTGLFLGWFFFLSLHRN